MVVAAIVGGVLAAAGPAAAANPATAATPAGPGPAAVQSVQSLIPHQLSTTPAYAGDFPDPFVVRVGGTYWAYATGSAGRNLQVINSPDLKTWSKVSDPLPTLGSWETTGLTWAPGVLPVGSGYVMYYTAHQKASGRQCISVATSSTPGGPFTPAGSGPLVCQLDHSGSIDANPYVANGVAYLLWKSDDNASGGTTRLWGQRLSANGLSLVGSPTQLLVQDASWQSPIIEGPSMVASGSSYFLFYGANQWDTANAAIGYATCQTPLGPCSNASRRVPWMKSHGAALGPSGPANFATADGTQKIAYHAWTGPGVGYQNGGVRSLWIDTLRFVRGRPVAG
jgi:beta-xylosidase